MRRSSAAISPAVGSSAAMITGSDPSRGPADAAVHCGHILGRYPLQTAVDAHHAVPTDGLGDMLGVGKVPPTQMASVAAV